MKIIDYFKKLLYQTPFYKQVRWLYRKIIGYKMHPLQEIKTKRGLNYKRLGSQYGGWEFIHDENLYNSIILSAGIGEDATFDIEFSNKYNSHIIMIDPTPRAINHFENILNNLGNPQTTNYVDKGAQLISSYDLSNVNKDNFTLINKALYDRETNIKFYEPKDPNHVSHSISNFQNNYSKDGKYINVKTTTIKKIIDNLKIPYDKIQLIKLDIEGAEIEVINNLLEDGFRPKQLLIEFDELINHSEKSVKRVDKTHDKLIKCGYICCKTDGQTNFLYLHTGKV